jgi:hypothetical protein
VDHIAERLSGVFSVTWIRFRSSSAWLDMAATPTFAPLRALDKLAALTYVSRTNFQVKKLVPLTFLGMRVC